MLMIFMVMLEMQFAIFILMEFLILRMTKNGSVNFLIYHLYVPMNIVYLLTFELASQRWISCVEIDLFRICFFLPTRQMRFRSLMCAFSKSAWIFFNSRLVLILI